MVQQLLSNRCFLVVLIIHNGWGYGVFYERLSDYIHVRPEQKNGCYLCRFARIVQIAF